MYACVCLSTLRLCLCVYVEGACVFFECVCVRKCACECVFEGA